MSTSATVKGLTNKDFCCPICNEKAQQKMDKGFWIICRTHGCIEGNPAVAYPHAYKVNSLSV